MRRVRKVFSEEISDVDLTPDKQEEVLALIYSKDHGVNKKGEPIVCSYVYCEDCIFWYKDDCSGAMYDWLMEEI